MDDGKYLDLELAVKGTSAAAQEYRGENSGLWFGVGLGKMIFSQKVNSYLYYFWVKMIFAHPGTKYLHAMANIISVTLEG